MAASIELHPVGRNSLGGRLSIADDDDERVKMLPRGGDEESDNEGEDALLHSDREGAYEDNDDSPEAIVRKTVPTTDDPTLPTLTFRVIVLGTFFCVMGASSSMLFYFKSNAPSFSSYFVILASYPMGNAMALWLPKRRLPIIGELNPGPFNLKEHLLVGVFASAGGSAAYASDILAILSLYYKVELGAVAGITLLLTTQLIGFGLSGLLQELLVKPVSMFWPSSLVVVSLYHTLHEKSSTLTRDRLRFFVLAAIAVFVYQFLPSFIFPTLTSVPLLCLLTSPTPSVLRTLGSGYTGFGMFDFSFDWSSVGWSGPLYTPWWALVNIFGGLIGMIWVVVPVLYAFNFWDAQSFPSAVGAGLFNTNFTKFDVASIINSTTLELDEAAYAQEGPLLLTPYFAISYALSFASLTSVIMHVYLYHGEEIKRAFFSRGKGKHDDVHNRLMEEYPEVPSTWYWGILLLNLAASVMLVTFAPLQTPVWALFLALFLAIIFLVPIGIVSAISGTQIGLNVISEFVIGLLMPGFATLNIFFKCFAYMCMGQALALTEDLKVAWYLKVPYKSMFKVQVLGTVVGALVNYFTLIDVIASKRPYLDGTLVDPTGQWTGRAPAVFYSASVIWGLVAPARFFSGKYWVLYLGFPLGIVVPLILYWLHKKYPTRHFDKVVFPIICSGATVVPQNPANIVLSGVFVAWFFQKYLTKRFPLWIEKYKLTLSAALDAATSLNAMLVYYFFTALLGGVEFPNWWGNPGAGGDSEHCR